MIKKNGPKNKPEELGKTPNAVNNVCLPAPLKSHQPYIYVYVYVYVYVYIYIYTYLNTYVCIYNTHTHTHIYIYLDPLFWIINSCNLWWVDKLQENHLNSWCSKDSILRTRFSAKATQHKVWEGQHKVL